MARWNRIIRGYGEIAEAYEDGEIDATEAGKRMAALLRRRIGDVLDLGQVRRRPTAS